MKNLYYLLISLLVISLVACTNNKENKIDYHQNALDAEQVLNEIDSLYTAEKNNDTLTPEKDIQFEKDWNDQYEQVKEAYALYFKESINTPEGQSEFETSKWTRRLNIDQLESVLNAATGTFKQSEFYEKLNQRLLNMKASMPGSPYKNINAKDQYGSPIELADYIGKGNYVLLDFWASWCPPCRKEMPNLVAIYEEYKGNGLEIVGYSLDDNEAAWISGLEKMNMTWPQMSDLKGWESAPVAQYAVQSIPCMILIDPHGEIIERGLDAEKLLLKIRTLLH